MQTIDLIILSYAKTPALRAVTEYCVSSALASEPAAKIRFNILVIESQKDAAAYQGEGVTTLFPQEPFGYHAYMNIGLRQTAAPFVCLCNNDLYFHPGWASAMLDAFAAQPQLQSASPLCSKHHPKVSIHQNSGLHFGYGVRREVAGWCLFFRREMLKITGPLDENLKFWFADNDYAKTLEKHQIPHALVTDSVVDHLESETLSTLNPIRQRLMTKRAKFYFDKKWNGLKGLTYARKLAQFYVKLGLFAIKTTLTKQP